VTAVSHIPRSRVPDTVTRYRRFAYKVVRQLVGQLDCVQLPVGAIDASDALNWLRTRTGGVLPMGLDVFKSQAKSATRLTQLLTGATATPVYKAFAELQANYNGGACALIFASTGDGLPEMVLHNLEDQLGYTLHTGCWITLTDGTQQYTIETLGAFIQRVNRGYPGE